ncbi:hypothetical protein AS132_14295 [Photobacterium sanguinicancri]|nr:hypothetical protein AS132_14295 [Photobacterium sanguinicancri]
MFTRLKEASQSARLFYICFWATIGISLIKKKPNVIKNIRLNNQRDTIFEVVKRVESHSKSSAKIQNFNAIKLLIDVSLTCNR